GWGSALALHGAFRACASREQLVPAAETRLGRLDKHLELAHVGRGVAAVGVPPHQLAELAVYLPARRGGRRRSRRVGVWSPQRRGEFPQSRRVGRRAVGARRGLLDHAGAGLELDLHVLSRLQALGELLAPGLEVVDPGLDGESIVAELRDRELPTPAVIDQR